MACLRPLDMTLTFSTLYALTTVTATLTADNHYGLYAGHAELSTWAMMIIGFSGVGLQMHRRGRCDGLNSNTFQR